MDQIEHDVYRELKQLARHALSPHMRQSTFSPTVLVHEVWMKLAKQAIPWTDKHHYLGFAAKAMRGILIDHIRTQTRQKRGGSAVRVTLAEDLVCGIETRDVEQLDQVLNELEVIDPEKAKMVELRFFCGCSIDETAQVMGVSPATIKRSWRFTRAWLFARLGGSSETTRLER